MAALSAFSQAMDAFAVPQMQWGENGAVELTAAGVGEARVALFFALVRGMTEGSLHDLVRGCMKEAELCSNPQDAAQVVADVFVMAFQTRHCRGGKGEKQLFDMLLLRLYEEYPATVLALIKIVPRFGSYKDYFRVLNLLGDLPKYNDLRETILDRVSRQLQADNEKLNSAANVSPSPPAATDAAAVMTNDDAAVTKTVPSISLCAKYAPREGSAGVRAGPGKEWFRRLRELMFPGSINTKEQYRKMITRLTAALDLPEVKMSANTFKDIDFGRVPSLCLNRCRKAFLNEIVARTHSTSFKGALKCQPKRPAARATSKATSGAGDLRHPESEDRMLCRQHLLEATKSKALHGKVLHPHTIVAKLMPATVRATSSAEREIFDVQWEKIRQDLVKNMEKLAMKAAATTTQQAGRPIDFTKLVPLVDVSGSMAGDPMHAAIALGTLVSEVNHASFRNRFISFETTPRWVDLSACANIADKVRTAANSPWGGSTDLLKAFDLILGVVEKARLPIEEIPDLIIFSDMQFDGACGNAKTHLQLIREKFAKVGKKISGKPYPIPRIVFWNLRAVQNGGFPANAYEENVQMLSGFSPSMLEVVLSGEPLETEVEVENDKGETVKVTKKVTPYQTLRKLLDSNKYDVVRKILSESQENSLANYTFIATATQRTAEASAQDDDSVAMVVTAAADDAEDWEVL
jgi:hypothetical protein